MGNKKGKTNKSKRRAGKNFRRPAGSIVPAQPRCMDVIFTIESVQTLTEAAAGIGELFAYRLNSLYDYNATGAGVQPIGYDQWSAFFNRSVVTNASFEVNMSNAGSGPALFGYFPLVGASPVPGSTGFSSQYGGKSRILSTTGVNVTTFRANYDIAKWLGISRAKLMAEEEYSESPAGPAVAGNNQLFLYVFVRGIGSAASAAVRVKVRFTAHLFEPNCFNVS